MRQCSSEVIIQKDRTFPLNPFPTNHNSLICLSVADPEGGSSGSLEPPFETKLFHFHREFSENLEKKNQVQLTNRTTLCKFEPPIKKSVKRNLHQFVFDFQLN